MTCYIVFMTKYQFHTKGGIIIMNATSVGFIAGLMIAAIALVFIFRYANKDGKVRTEYDERQKALRGKAYKYAFYAEIFAQLVIMMIFMAGIDVPVEDYALVFSAILFGCIVLATYCIWNDVYWGLNNNHRRYLIVFAIATVLNILPLIGNVRGGTLMENGKIGLPLLNILVLIMMAVICVELLVKKAMDKDTGEEG